MMYRLHWGAGVAVLAALGACNGSISVRKADPNGGALCSNSVDPGPSFIRRVTRLEYDNTVRDLLGATSPAAGGFPTEETRLGFDNNASALTVSPVLAEQYLLTAEKLATDAVNNNFAALVPCDPTTAGVDACGQQFIATFAKRAYRRPPAPEDLAALTAVFNVGKATDFKTGVRLVIETALQTPQFLYRVETGLPLKGGEPTVKFVSGTSTTTTQVVRLDSWEMASRLSFLLWRTMPDDELFRAAEANQLQDPADIAAQVTRMLQDPKARSMVAAFHDQWLRVGEIDGVEKDAALFPGFDATMAGLMQVEMQKFLDYVVWDGEGTMGALFSAPYTFVNGPLAQFYGIQGVTGNSFVKVALDPTQRAGFLTQGGLLSLLAKANQTSPVHRGKFVREQLLCMTLPPPPPNIMVKPPELSGTLTTRQRFTQHSIDPNCSTCHHLMDPIGLGFENFDGAGRFRDTENGQAIDASGRIDDADVAGPFNGAMELQQKLSGSAQVQQCMTTEWFRYANGRSESDVDSCTLATLQQKFAAGGYKIQDLIIALTQSKAFLYRRVTPAAGGSS